MSGSPLSDEDLTRFREAAREFDIVDRTWNEKYDQIAARHGGEWVAFHEGRVVAHSPNPEELRAGLDAIGPEADTYYVTFVFPADVEFVL